MAEIPIDFTGVTAASSRVHDAVNAFGVQHGVPAWIAVIVAHVSAALVFVALFVVAAVVQGVVGVGTFFAVTILGVITKVRTENASDFNQVIAAALSELLGIEISAASIPSGTGPRGIDARITAIGEALHGLLAGEFVVPAPITPEQGQRNAQKFSGYAINFATGSAFISILTEAVSIGFLKEFRELGVETAQALGLGRLQRLALQPLIRNAIQQPSDLYYKGLLRPDRLSEAQIVQALKAGLLEDGAARQMLAEKGYPDPLIDILLNLLATKIPVSDLARLIRYNVITEQQAIEKMTEQGIDPDDAKLLLQSTEAGLADSQVGVTLADAETALLEGFIDQGTWNSIIADLPLTQEQERLYRKRVGFKLERPRKHITFAQLKSGVVEGIIDFDFVDTWLTNQGYTDEEHLILTFEIIQALATAEAKAAAKKTTAGKVAAGGKPVPKPLTTP